MTGEVFNVAAQRGERVHIQNPRSVPVKVVLRIGSSTVEFGLTGGQFFAVVRGDETIAVEFRDIDGSELEHPGPIGPDVVPGQPNRH